MVIKFFFLGNVKYPAPLKCIYIVFRVAFFRTKSSLNCFNNRRRGLYCFFYDLIFFLNLRFGFWIRKDSFIHFYLFYFYFFFSRLVCLDFDGFSLFWWWAVSVKSYI